MEKIEQNAKVLRQMALRQMLRGWKSVSSQQIKTVYTLWKAKTKKS